MGTVVGAIIFYLSCRANPILQPLLFEAATTASSVGGTATSALLDATRLTLLAAYGLAYCYIASAPILVFHAGRFLLKLDTGWGTKLKWIAICLSVPAVAAVVTCVRPPTSAINQGVSFSASVFVLALILWLQAVVVYQTLVRSAELYNFYVRLSARRETAKGEITDSYRHLREHGNSFFIVLLEVVLAVVLFGAGRLTAQSSDASSAITVAWAIHIMIIVAWILLAVFVWVIGTVFERRFSEG